MERESLDGRDGDDERTENERSPPPRSRPTTRDHARKEAERRRSRGNTPSKDMKDGHELKSEINHQDRKRRHSRSRSRSALRDRDQSELNENEVKIEKPIKNDMKIKIENHNVNENNHEGHDQLDSRGENGMKKRRRLRNGNRRSRKRHHNRGPNRHDRDRDRHHDNHNRKYKPYTELSWEERQQRDEQESKRAAMKRANRPTPYNTTQFLMEDHKVDTPDLSSVHHKCDSSDEIEDEMNGDYLEKDFAAVYEEVQSERLESMSKEQLVTDVLTLQRRVTELEEEQKKRLSSSAGESDQSSNGQLVVDKGLRKRLESLSSLEGEVQRLRSENTKLRKASVKEPIGT
ncbi:LOW QUALITY PROTEIN: uncharacterized protein [Amphiura filiformis]|uniref:LOW QUALITY PROTEIN: uncharacterized protein n=1 Tax=Amphiura filiformis TaxID=82378 RepID=UPI003B21200D